MKANEVTQIRRDDLVSSETIHEFLRRELTRRISENPRYSLRSFARALKLSPAMLSMVLAGKATLSHTRSKKIADVLGIYLKPLSEDRIPNSPDAVVSHRAQSRDVDLDFFFVVSEWYHYAILSLLKLPDQNLEPRWISRRLGISTMEARLAVARLKELGLMAMRDGRWHQTGGEIRVEGSSANAASRRFQKQLLLRALDAIEAGTPDLRDISSMTFAMDKAAFGDAVREISQFRRGFSERIENTCTPTDVYNLTIQLVPVTYELKTKAKEKK